jgi:thiol:disulfide interchange protein DsbD
VFVIFALSFFGLFEITLPSSWANKTDRAADRGGLLGIFFMAFTLSLVSFSCTGPIIGTLLVEAATGTGGPIILGRIPVGPLVGMFGFSLALALPFALFAAFPGWLNSLPKSGGWMNGVKVTLGFVEIALALKFLSVADLTMGWKILPYELFVGLWVLCALGLALYYFKIIRFPHDSRVKGIATPRMVLGIAALALTVYLSFGFRYSEQSGTFATPNLLSGLAPPAGHSYIFPKECPLNLNCFKDFDEGREYAGKVNKPILLDFTGHGCVNCRRMEDNVWSQEGVYQLIRDNYVLISLYVDERKPLKEPYVSAFDGDLERTIGNKWSDFQAIHFNRNSQPYYVLMSDEGKILNEPVAYTPDKNAYQEFLECGIEQYNELCGNCLSER